MEDPVTYRGAVYPWHCDHIGHMNAALCELTGVHVDRGLRKAAVLPPDVAARARGMLAPAPTAA